MATFLQRIADQTFLVHHKTKKILVVGPRDFVIMLHANREPDGTIWALVCESERNDLVPETKGIIRGALPLGGWKLTPNNGDPNSTLCSYIAEIDLKGSIPGFVMNMAIKDQGNQLLKLRKAVIDKGIIPE